MDLLPLEFVAPHCDIRTRLRAVPLEAQVRGMMYRPIIIALQTASKLDSYVERFGRLNYASISFYSLRDYMIRLASAAAVLTSPEEIYLGMAEISRNNAREMSRSLLGRVLIHALAGDPWRLLQQGIAMRRQTFAYGRWELVHHGPRDLEVRYFDEYVWIEQALTPAAAGTFDVCDIKPQITTTLLTPYSGSTRFRW